MKRSLGNGPLVLALAIATLLVGCGSYAEISPEAYQYTMALYSVCNRKDAPRLVKVAEQIKNARAESQLTATEADWIDGILATAQAGDWQDATREARQLLEAQVAGR